MRGIQIRNLDSLLSGKTDYVYKEMKQPEPHFWRRLPGYQFHKYDIRTGNRIKVKFYHSYQGRVEGIQFMRCHWKVGQALYVKEPFLQLPSGEIIYEGDDLNPASHMRETQARYFLRVEAIDCVERNHEYMWRLQIKFFIP